MATIETIGTTGRNYSTLQAWEDAVPATPTGGYEGHCYNDSQFTGTLSISGHTTSGTDYIKLTAATGQSFQDHGSVRSNALYYNQSNGVGISAGGGSSPVINIDNDNVTIDRLQIRRTGSAYNNAIVNASTNNQTNITIKDCIIGKEHTTGYDPPLAVPRNGKLINCVLYDTDASPSNPAVSLRNEYGSGTPLVLNCTIVATAGGGTTGVSASNTGNACKLQNTAIFGYSTPATHGGGSWAAGSDYNAATAASGLPGANSLHSRTASSELESATNDFRLKTGATLIDAGNTDGTNAPNDISGTARGATTDGDIGAWEFSGGGGGGPTGPPTGTWAMMGAGI
jgi:hypothetical protein